MSEKDIPACEERIEVGYRNIGSVMGVDYHHKQVGWSKRSATPPLNQRNDILHMQKIAHLLRLTLVSFTFSRWWSCAALTPPYATYSIPTR